MYRDPRIHKIFNDGKEVRPERANYLLFTLSQPFWHQVWGGNRQESRVICLCRDSFCQVRFSGSRWL